jgi:hypothetical protein
MEGGPLRTAREEHWGGSRAQGEHSFNLLDGMLENENDIDPYSRILSFKNKIHSVFMYFDSSGAHCGRAEWPTLELMKLYFSN